MGKIDGQSAYDTFSLYMYLIVNLVFPNWSVFLIAPFSDRCLLVPFYDTFSQYKYLIIKIFANSVFGMGMPFWLRNFLIIVYFYLSIEMLLTWVLIASVPDHYENLPMQ